MNALNQFKKVALSIKTYASLSFIIFLLPFLQTCSDRVLISQQKGVYSLEDLREVKKEHTFNAYEFSYDVIKDFKIKNFKEASFCSYLIYPLIIVLSIIILIQAFRDKFKLNLVLSIINIFLLFISLLLMISEEMIENIKQLKIGWYLFLLNSLLILYLSYQKGFKESKS